MDTLPLVVEVAVEVCEFNCGETMPLLEMLLFSATVCAKIPNVIELDRL